MTDRIAGHAGIVILALAAFVSIAAAGPADDMRVIREKADEMVRAVMEARTRPQAEGEPSRIERAYNGYAYLLTPEKVKEVEQLVAQAPDEATKQLWQRTADVLALHAVQARVASIQDAFSQAEVERTVKLPEGKIGLRGLDRRIAVSEERDARRNLWLASAELYPAARVYQRSILMGLQQDAQSMTNEPYYLLLARAEQWEGAWSPDQITTTAQNLLAATAEAWRAGLARMADETMDLELRQVRSYDVGRLLLLPNLEDHLDRIRPERILERTSKEFGLDVSRQRTLKIDIDDKDGRTPAPRAWPQPSGRGQITMVPPVYPGDVQDLLGALGEAEFTYLVPGAVPFERAYAGTNVYPAAYRTLLAMMAEEPAWIERHLEPKKEASAEAVAEQFTWRRLHDVRAAAGRWLFQRRLQEDPSLDPAVYSETMERALAYDLYRSDEEAYFYANDDFRSGGALMGFALAAQMRDVLREELGPEWFRSPELGRRLEEGAAQGLGMPAETFLAIWKLDSVDPSALIAGLTDSAGQVAGTAGD